jgi:hypothetical protein
MRISRSNRILVYQVYERCIGVEVEGKRKRTKMIKSGRGGAFRLII